MQLYHVQLSMDGLWTSEVCWFQCCWGFGKTIWQFQWLLLVQGHVCTTSISWGICTWAIVVLAEKNPRIVLKIRIVHQMLPWFQLILYLAPTEQWRCSMRWNCRSCTIPEVLSFSQKRRLQVVQLQNRLFTKFRLASDSFVMRTSIGCKLCCFRTCLWTKFWPSLRSWRNELYSDSSVCSLQHLSFGAVDFFPKKFWQFHCLLLLQSGVADRKAKVGAPCVHMGASVERVALSCGLCLSIPPIKVCGCHAVVGLPVPHSDQ